LTAPQILGCATAVPPRRFSQEEVFALSPYTSERIRKIFLNSDIEFRHLWLPEDFAPTETADQLHARYLEGAMHLSCLAARDALGAAGVAAEEVDCILVASCTGYVCPDLSTRLVAHLGLRSGVQRGALLGHGCAGALPMLQRAADFVRANPGRRALAVAVEVCSAAYFLDTSMETIIGNAICADGAAAVVVTSDGAAQAPAATANNLPRILAFESTIDSEHLDKVGLEQRDGKMRIILGAEIRDLAGPIIERCLDGLLTPRGLRREDIRHWVLHPGGRKVIDCAAEYLGLGEAQLERSRQVLRNYGNMSSPTVLFVLDDFVRSASPQPGDYGVLMALGPGFAAEGALVQW